MKVKPLTRFRAGAVSGGVTPTTVLHLHFKGVRGRLRSEGRPAEFELRGGVSPFTTIFRVEPDPHDPAGVNLLLCTNLAESVHLVCGPGVDPTMNIVDEKDMPLPAFGPVPVPIK